MRRIISVLLVLAMLFSCGMVAMAEEAATPAVGVEEIDFLAKLGIMDADADPEATITRAEMAKIVMMCIGQGEDLAPTDTPFTDVNISNEYSGYIQLANSAGIMVGGGDGKFNPNGNVTYNQMVKLLTHAIGHEAFAQAAGGYPGGYLITASNNEMLVGTTPSGEQAVSHGVAAILIKNALNIDVYERIAYGDSYEYVSKAGVTTLTKFFDVYEVQGVITANHFASISGTASLKDDEILLDGATIMKTGESGAEDYLGYLVNLYVKVDKDARYNTIVAAYPLETATTVVNGEDVMNRTSETLLVYLNAEGEEEELKIDTNADMIFNGSPKFWSAADLKGNFGDITAIDNDSDGDVDVFVVYNFKNVIVNTIKASESRVFTKNEVDPAWQSIVMDPESRSVKTTIVNTDGEDITVEDFEEWNVLSVAVSESGDVMKVILCDETLEGTIESYGDDTITVDGTEYDYDVTKVAAPSAADFEREAVFYLDFAGRIAAINFDGAIAGMEYGYVRAAASSGTGFGRKAEIEMLVPDGITVFELAKEVKLNGAVVSNEAAIADAAIQDGGVAKKQLIMYSLDEEGKVDKINTYVDDTANVLSEKEKADTFTLDGIINGDSTRYQGGSFKGFGGKYLARENTKVFIVQDPEAAVDREDLYKVWSPSTLSAYYWANAKFYDIDENHIIGAVVLQYADGMFSRSTGHHTGGIVTGISQALNDEGDPVQRYAIINQSGIAMTLDLPVDQKTVAHTVATNIINQPGTADDGIFDDAGAVKAELTLADIKIGDFIQYSTNRINNKIEQIRLVARLGALDERINDIGASRGTVSSERYYYIAAGTITDIFRDGIEFRSYNKATATPVVVDELLLIASSTKVLHYDTATQKLTTISKAELVEGDKIFYYAYGGMIVVVD